MLERERRVQEKRDSTESMLLGLYCHTPLEDKQSEAPKKGKFREKSFIC